MNPDQRSPPHDSIAKIFSLFLKLPRLSSADRSQFSLQPRDLQDFAKSTFSISTALSQIHFSVSVELETLEDFANSPNERSAFSVYFQVISVCFVSPESLTAVVLARLLTALSVCVGFEHWETLDFCFRSLLETALSLLQFEWTEEVLLLVLECIEGNAALSNASYRPLISVAGIALRLKLDSFFARFFPLLTKCLSSGRAIVRDANRNALVSYIMPFLQRFDGSAMALMAQLSRCSNDLILSEVYAVLAQFLVSLVEKYPPVYGLEITAGESEAVVCGVVPVGEGLRDLPAILYEQQGDLARVLDADIRLAVAATAGILLSSSDAGVDAFQAAIPLLIEGFQGLPVFWDCLAAFLSVVRQANCGLSDQLVATLIDCKLFDQQQSAFGPASLDPCLNAFRAELLALMSDEQVIRFLKRVQEIPVIFTETFARLIAEDSRVAPLRDDGIIELVFENAAILQRQQNGKRSLGLSPALGGCLTALFRLAMNRIVDAWSNSRFASACLQCLEVAQFERFVLDSAAAAARFTQDLQYVVATFRNALPRHPARVAGAIVAIVKERPRAASSFVVFFNEFLSLQDPGKFSELLLLLLFFHSRDTQHYELTDDVLAQLVDVLSPSHAVFNWILRLAGREVIVRPTFILLLLAVFGVCERVLATLLALAQFSPFNARALHSSGIDLILLLLLRGEREVSYGGGVFRWGDSCAKIAHQLLRRVCIVQSDYPIAFLFCKWLKRDPSLAGKTLLEVFKATNGFARSRYALGTLSPFFVGLLTRFSNEFVVEFDIVLDFPVLSESNASVTVFAIEDKFGSRFTLFVHGTSLFGLCFTPESKSSKLLCHLKVAKKWTHVRIVFGAEHGDRPNISLEINRERVYVTTMKKSGLLDAVTLSLGGFIHCPRDEWLNVEMGELSTLVLSSSSGKVLFSTETATDIKRMAPRLTLIDCFAVKATIRKLARHAPASDDGLLCLKQLFRHSAVAQSVFKCDNRVFSAIAGREPTVHWYLLLHSVGSVITDERLADQWFDRVILNPAIWARAPFTVLLKIIYHWATVVVSQHQSLFRRTRLFVPLLFRLHVFLLPDSDVSYANPAYTPAETSVIRSQYLLFLKRVAFLRFVPSDSDALFQLCLNGRARLCYLELIRDCAGLLSDKENLLQLITAFVTDADPDVAALALTALHELAGPRFHFCMHVLWWSKPPQSPSVLRERIVGLMPEYPNLFSAVSMLGLLCGDADKVAPALYSLFANVAVPREADSFIWPLFLSLRLSSGFRDVVIRPIIDLVPREDILRVFHLLAAQNPSLGFALLQELLMNEERPPARVFDCFLGHLFLQRRTPTGHSMALLAALRDSPFSAEAPPEDPSDASTSSLLPLDPGRGHLSYGLRVGADGSWVDAAEGRFALKLAQWQPPSELEVPPLIALIRYLLDRDSVPPPERLMLLSQAQPELARLRQQFTLEAEETAKTLGARITDLCQEAHEAAVALADWESGLRRTPRWLPEHLAEEASACMLAPESLLTSFVRDRTLCADFFPAKVKRSRFKRPRPALDCGDGLFFGCRRIRVNGSKSVNLQVRDTDILVAFRKSHKVISFADIELALPRGSSGLELIVHGGHSFLLDFTPGTAAAFLQRVPPARGLVPAWVMAEYACGPVSNFKHLMRMNLACGRSFDNPAAPPVLPTRDFASTTDAFFPGAILGEDFDAVYERRKELERPPASAALPEWVERTFGLVGHPPKFNVTAEVLEELTFDIRFAQDEFRFAAVTREAGAELRFAVVLGAVAYFHGLFFPCRGAHYIGERSIEIGPRAKFAAASGRITIFDPDRGAITRVDDSRAEVAIFPADAQPMAVIGDQVIIAVSPAGLTVDTVSTWQARARIAAVAGSAVFHVVVVALWDGSLEVVSFPRWRAVRRASLEGEVARRIIVTDSIGMILVFTKRHTWVFSINADFVRKAATNEEILYWTPFVSNSGFDYILYGDAHGEVGWFEALYPEKKTTLFRFPDLVMLYYKKSEQSIVALSARGKVKIYLFSAELPI
jgi:hypothetical protein